MGTSYRSSVRTNGARQLDHRQRRRALRLVAQRDIDILARPGGTGDDPSQRGAGIWIRIHHAVVGFVLTLRIFVAVGAMQRIQIPSADQRPRPERAQDGKLLGNGGILACSPMQ